jgi:hypothetical protein
VLKQSVSNWTKLSAVIPRRARGALAATRSSALPGNALDGHRAVGLLALRQHVEAVLRVNGRAASGRACMLEWINMKRLCVAIFLVAASSALPVDPAWDRSAFAQGETTAREAFEAAKELGTPAAWNAFLASFPNGFYADLARAYLKNLGESSGGAAAAPAATPVPAGSGSAPAETPKVELGANANLNGVRLLPDDSPWYQDISKAPVDRNSARILARVGNKPLHPDFGPVWRACPSASLTSS